MIINMIGGGASLNYSVVGGTTQPTSPKENMIWVNTSTAITSHVFSATKPTSPVGGMVWFNAGTSATAPFNTLKKNALWVYPTGCAQYVGGAWVVKEAKTYQGSAWVDWRNYLYAENQAELSPWFAKKWPLNANYANGTNNASVTFKQENGAMVIGGTAIDGMSIGAVYDEIIDFSLYTTIVITYAQSVDASMRRTLWSINSSLGGAYLTDNRIAFGELTGTTKNTVNIDVSAITQPAYLYIGRQNGTGQTYSGTIDTTSIYMVELK